MADQLRIPPDELAHRLLEFEKRVEALFYMVDAVLEDQHKEIKKLKKRLKNESK